MYVNIYSCFLHSMLNIFLDPHLDNLSAGWDFFLPEGGSGNVGGITDICLYQWISAVTSWPAASPREKHNQRDSLSAGALPGWSVAEFL